MNYYDDEELAKRRAALELAEERFDEYPAIVLDAITTLVDAEGKFRDTTPYDVLVSKPLDDCSGVELLSLMLASDAGIELRQRLENMPSTAERQSPYAFAIECIADEIDPEEIENAANEALEEAREQEAYELAHGRTR